MSSWPPCVFVAHIWRQLQMLSSGSSAKHSWNQWRSLGRGDGQREEEGEPQAPKTECGFPITRKLFGPDSGITRCSLKPRGKMGMEDQRQRGKGWKSRENCGVEAAGLVLPWAEGSSPVRLPGYPGSDLVTSRPWLSDLLALVRLGGVRGEQRAPRLLRDLQMCFHWPYPVCPLGLTQCLWFQVPLFESSTCELEQPRGSQGESVRRFGQNPGKPAPKRLNWGQALKRGSYLPPHCTPPPFGGGATDSLATASLLQGSCHQLRPHL